MTTLEQLNSAIDRALSMDYTISIYSHKNFNTCNINKHTASGAQVQVEGRGETLNEAIEKCFANFPENPLDGTGWQNNRLSAPPIDAEFTEVKKDH